VKEMATTMEFNAPPQFNAVTNGKATSVTLAAWDYCQLLICANVTDPTLWPPGYEDAARAFATVRRLEAQCITEHGAWDWETLSAEEQDEYDSALCDLSNAEGGGKPWEQYLAERGLTE
jgi:hypothetical protein